MSKETVQFTELIRQASTTLEPDTTRQYCPECGKNTMHLIREQLDWEYHTCNICGNTQEYRTR